MKQNNIEKIKELEEEIDCQLAIIVAIAKAYPQVTSEIIIPELIKRSKD